MSRLLGLLRTAVLFLSVAVLMVAGCASGPKSSSIPEEAIRGRADRAFDDLKAEETGQKKPAYSKHNETQGTEQTRQSDRQSRQIAQGPTGKKPDWVDGRPARYPAEQYLTGVGLGDTRKAAEDSAYAAISRIFQAQIDSRTEEWEKYVQTEIKGKVQSTRDIQISQLTSVATKKVLEDITIAEIWADDAERLTYALAVMDRAHAAAVLREKIAEMDRDVLDLQSKAANTGDKIEAVRSLRRTMKILLNRDVYNTDLRIVSPSGKGIDPPASLTSIRQKTERLLSNDIRVGVKIDGQHGGRIRSAILEGLTREGFSIEQTEELSKMDVLVKGKVNFEKADMPRWKFIRWAISVDLVNQSNGKIFGSLTEDGREGHLNFSEAEERAVRVLQKEVVNKLSEMMVSFIFGQTSES